MKLHILKNSESEAVVKVYTSESAGDIIDVSLENALTKDTQVYVPSTSDINETTSGGYALYTGSHVIITGMWWGCKKDKQVDVSRIIDPVTPVIHNHYYLLNSGFMDFKSAGFADRIYAGKDIRVQFDGPGFIILRLSKMGWLPKVENSTFGSYDDPTQVGA